MEESTLIGLGVGMLNILLAALNYVLSSLAIYKIAEVEKINNPWLAWIPVANSYMLIKVAGGNMFMLILAVISFITGSTTTAIVGNQLFTIFGVLISAVWSIYAIMLYNRLCDKYNVNIMLFVASFIAPIAIYFRVLAPFYVPLIAIGFYAHYKLYKNASNGITSKVNVQSKVVLSKNKKKK